MEEQDYTIRAILKRHPKITFSAALVLMVALEWPLLDFVWHRFILGF